MNPLSTLCVMNVAYDVKIDQIQTHFRKFGAIKAIKMPLSPNGKPRGIFHIEFEEEADAEYAKDQENHKTVFGRKMHIQWNKFKLNPFF